MVKSGKDKVTSMKTMKAVAMKAVAKKAVASTTPMKAVASTTPMKVKKAHMKSKPNPRGKSKSLTAANVKKVGGDDEQDLDTKMDHFRQGLLSQAAFSNEEKRCLWNRFHAAKQLNSDAASKWDTLPSTGRGNQNVKNAFLWAWLKDPAWGKHFMERVNTLTVSQKHKKKLSWLTYKQLCDKHGKDEADDLIKSKSIHMRANPKNNKFYQFLDEDEEFDISNERKKAFNASQKGDIKATAFKSLCAGFGNITNDEMESLHAQPDFNDQSEEDEDDENEQTALPSALKKLMGLKKTKNKSNVPDPPNSGKGSSGTGKDLKGASNDPNGDDKKLKTKILDEMKATCTVLGEDDKSAVLAKASKMHSILSKVVKDRDPDTKKKLQVLMVKLQAKIFSKSTTGVKELLIDAAKVMKASEKK
jgi:hypothetical protein